MMEIKIKLSDIDYDAVIDALAPVLASSKRCNTTASPAFEKAKGWSLAAVKATLRALPQGARDKLAAVCLNHYSEELSRMIAGMVRRQSFALEVQGIEAAGR